MTKDIYSSIDIVCAASEYISHVGGSLGQENLQSAKKVYDLKRMSLRRKK